MIFLHLSPGPSPGREGVAAHEMARWLMDNICDDIIAKIEMLNM